MVQSSYFKQVPQEIQTQHIQAITTVRELMDSTDLSLKMVYHGADVDHITFISNSVAPGTLYKQISVRYTLIIIAVTAVTTVSFCCS